MSSFFSLSLLAVIVAALLDIVANLLLAKSQGFRRKFIGFASLGMVGLAFYALSLAVRDMDLAVARAMAGVPREIQIRLIYNCSKADPAYGKGVADALGIPMSEVKL